MLHLNRKSIVYITPKAPFNFNGTFYNPGHFPTPTEEWQEDKWWQTMRFEGKMLGLKIENKETTNKPGIKLTIYSQKALDENFKKRLTQEIKYRFELNLDLSEFDQKFKSDRLLGPVIQKWQGMRSKCGYNLYESLMIYIVLQNATVHRTVQMMNALLEKFGDKVSFDDKSLYVIWEPETINKVSEGELRNLKVGYRAKFFKKISESFIKGEFNELELRKKNPEELRSKLLTLYGIGPDSVGNLLWEVFHNHKILDVLPPWEQKIYSRLLHNKELVPTGEILREIEKRWGRWKRLAAFYIWTDLFWRHKQKSIPWLAKEILL